MAGTSGDGPANRVVREYVHEYGFARMCARAADHILALDISTADVPRSDDLVQDPPERRTP